jgi:molybdopterin/thiamine biosynthesis adenylyltransferase
MKKDNLEKLLVKKTKEDFGFKPSVFNLKLERDRRAVGKLLADHKIQGVSDDYEEQLRELFGIKNPSMVYASDFAARFKVFHGDLKKELSLAEHGRWVFYPWLGAMVHVLPEKDFELVRTARNRNLITAEEQEKFYDATIGIGGLSIGSSVAAAIVLQGGGKRLRLADMDRLALTNTNRVRAGVENLGILKTVVAARQIYEMNPYANVEIFSDGLTPKNIGAFFNGLDIMIDEIDNLAVKFLIREQAKKRRIAVVMAADNGDNSVVDVERYDLNPKTPYFHGRMGKVTYAQLAALDKFGIGKMITKHVGSENVTERMQGSLLEMGKTIVSWPQLGGAALMSGAAVAYCVRKILNGQPLERNRAIVSLDEKLTPNYGSPAHRARRKEAADAFRKAFGL